jgi:hypothetical protein
MTRMQHVRLLGPCFKTGLIGDHLVRRGGANVATTARTSVAASRASARQPARRYGRRHAHRRRLHAQPSLKYVATLIDLQKTTVNARDAHGTTVRPQRARR